MEPEIILLVSAGGLFLLFLLVYMIVAINVRKRRKHEQQLLMKTYNEENLHKMEYDVAFYEGEAFRIFQAGNTARQMTIDEILNDDDKTLEQMTQRAIFSQMEDNDGEIIKGTYNPSK
ncbi:MAG: hypothetical protein K2O67_00360 [Clostridia bacterium]|nr:hypothetical protein [Clostridia bacterium]